MSLRDQEKVDGNNKKLHKVCNDDFNKQIAMKLIEGLFERCVINEKEYCRATLNIKVDDKKELRYPLTYSEKRKNTEGGKNE